MEERIGNVSTGLSEETVLAQLKKRKCVIAIDAQQQTEPCCICQVGRSQCSLEYWVLGEWILDIDHRKPFHVRDIVTLEERSVVDILKTLSMMSRNLLVEFCMIMEMKGEAFTK